MRALSRTGPKGFTFLELLIVVVILGVLAGLTIPVYQAAIEKSKTQEAVQMLSATRESMLRHYSAYGNYNQAAFPGLGGGPTVDEFGRPYQFLDFDPNVASNFYFTGGGGQTGHFFYTISWRGANFFLVSAMKMPITGPDWIAIDQTGTITKNGIYA